MTESEFAYKHHGGWYFANRPNDPPLPELLSKFVDGNAHDDHAEIKYHLVEEYGECLRVECNGSENRDVRLIDEVNGEVIARFV